MQTDPKDKKTSTEDFIESTPGELRADGSDTGEEKDLDDLVHNLPNSTIIPGEEIDADDAVHASVKKIPPQPENEVDPDDLVHGN